MARGQKKTMEEKIMAKEELILALEVRLKKEKEELQEMYDEKKRRELNSLNELLEENGLDIDSVKNMILQNVG